MSSISDKAIASMQMPYIKDLSPEENDIFLNKHKELLAYAKKNNKSNEVAMLFNSDMDNAAIEVVCRLNDYDKK